MPRSIVFRPSAKVNLTLRVGPARADGYHDVRTLMQSVALHDVMAITERSGPFGIATRSPGVPADRTNLVWRAAELLWEDLGRPGTPRNAHVRLDKQIPVAAGLGGGSADAAAALVGLNQIWDGRRSRRDLMVLAARLGSDVPFFLQGGTAIGLGRGDEIYPVDDVPRLGILIIKPSFGVGTAEAYGWLDADRAGGLVEPPAERRHEVEVGWPLGPVVLVNDLQGPVARRHPAIAEMIAACVAQGAMAAGMSGSGSAVFGVFAETAARRAAERIRRPDWLVLLTRTLTRREAGHRVGL